MNKDDSLEGEVLIKQLETDVFILTNKRVRYQNKSLDNSLIISSILLENISSIELHYTNNLNLLIIGILSSFTGLGLTVLSENTNHSHIALLILIIGLCLLLLYFFSRKLFLTIYSKGGGKINFSLKNLSKAASIHLINTIEQAIVHKNSGVI